MDRLVLYSRLTAPQAAALRRLEVTPEQSGACGHIESALYTLSKSPPEAVTGWALLVEEQPRAFLLLMRAPCLPAWASATAAVMLALQVDYRYQRQGLGKACLQALPGAVRGVWPEVDQLMLSVDPTNEAAMGLYRGLGWVDCGEAHRARVGYERQFVLGLSGGPFTTAAR